jgi:hypothetical protein
MYAANSITVDGQPIPQRPSYSGIELPAPKGPVITPSGNIKDKDGKQVCCDK